MALVALRRAGSSFALPPLVVDGSCPRCRPLVHAGRHGGHGGGRAAHFHGAAGARLWRPDSAGTVWRVMLGIIGGCPSAELQLPERIELHAGRNAAACDCSVSRPPGAAVETGFVCSAACLQCHPPPCMPAVCRCGAGRQHLAVRGAGMWGCSLLSYSAATADRAAAAAAAGCRIHLLHVFPPWGQVPV